MDNNSKYGVRIRALLITENEVEIVAKAAVRRGMLKFNGDS